MDPETVRRAIRLVQPGGAEGARLDGSTDDPSDGPADRSAPSSDGDQ
jgi:hypothetical protein